CSTRSRHSQRRSVTLACQVSGRNGICSGFPGGLLHTRELFHTSTASSPGLTLGPPRSSVASGAGLEPGAPRRALDLRNGHLAFPAFIELHQDAIRIAEKDRANVPMRIAKRIGWPTGLLRRERAGVASPRQR